jgi:hypothetical protein
MATLKEFEDALRQHGMTNALAILDELKKRDREKRSIAPARRVVGRKMTAELARAILDLHATTGMTQQEIAFKLGVNQGRVNEVIKRGKWLSADPQAPEALSRDRAMQRLDQRAKARRTPPPKQPETSRPLASAAPASSDGPAARIVAELPLDRPDAVHLARRSERVEQSRAPSPAAQPQSKPPSRRPLETPTPIVSAQLAFLDL